MQFDDAGSIEQLKMRLKFSEGSKCSNPEELGLRALKKSEPDLMMAGNHLGGGYDRALDILGTSMEEDITQSQGRMTT